MPPPTVGPHRVGKNANIKLNGTLVRHSGGDITVGGGTDTQTMPSGYDIRAATNRNATGSIRLLVMFGETLQYTSQTYHHLEIDDGTNLVFKGEIYIDSIPEDFANDGGWGYNMQWSSHDEFEAGIPIPPPE